jgi:thiamine kinase-like enzyme
VANVRSILTRLPDRLGAPVDAPIPLDGGITNRNYLVRMTGGEFVVRIPGRNTDLLGIDRRAERLAAERAAALGIAPELVHADQDCVVTAYVTARPVEPGQVGRDPAPFARALRHFHDSGLELPTRFWVPALLVEYEALVQGRGGRVPPPFARAREIVARIAQALPLSAPVPCHDDLLPGNLLVGAEGVLLVDWEYAGMGHRFFDLGNLAVNNDLDDGAEERLLEAYFESPPTLDRRAALKLMRIVSDAREGAWGVVQALISELDFDFSGYTAEHFGRMERAAGDPHLEEWLNAAAA